MDEHKINPANNENIKTNQNINTNTYYRWEEDSQNTTSTVTLKTRKIKKNKITMTRKMIRMII